jgi:hypothetical protein
MAAAESDETLVPVHYLSVALACSSFRRRQYAIHFKSTEFGALTRVGSEFSYRLLPFRQFSDQRIV